MTKYYFRYTDIGGVMRQVESTPTGRISISYVKNRAPRMGYSKVIDGRLSFYRDDYEKIMEHKKSWQCVPIDLIIRDDCGMGMQTVFSGQMFVLEGEYNEDQCKVSFSGKEKTGYECMEENWEDDWNIFGFGMKPLSTGESITTDGFPFINMYMYYLSVDSLLGEVSTLFYVPPSALNDYEEILKTENNFINNRGSTTDPTPLFNEITDFFNEGSNSQYIIRQRINGTPAPPLDQFIRQYYIIYEMIPGVYTMAMPTDRRYTLPEISLPLYGYDNDFPGWNRGRTTIPNGKKLSNIFTALLSKSCDTLIPKSQLFAWGYDRQPSSYVTNKASVLYDLVMHQKSDVKRPTADIKSSIGEMNFKWLLESLCTMLNLRYEIRGNEFIIEHVSWPGWTNSVTDLRDPKFEELMRGRNKYSYDYDQIPKREEFIMQDQYSRDFVGLPIKYNTECGGLGDIDKVTHTVENISTDVKAITEGLTEWFARETGEDKYEEIKDSYVSDEGWVLIATKSEGGIYKTLVTTGILEVPDLLSPEILPNNVLAWAQIQNDYFRHDRYLKFGEMNGEQEEFKTVKKYKKQDQLAVNWCCFLDFDPRNSVRTYLGSGGEVVSASYELYRRTITLEIVYQ